MSLCFFRISRQLSRQFSGQFYHTPIPGDPTINFAGGPRENREDFPGWLALKMVLRLSEVNDSKCSPLNQEFFFTGLRSIFVVFPSSNDL